MKKFFTLISLITFSTSVLAVKVCTQADFKRLYPTPAAHFHNCPGDTPQGYTASCVDFHGNVHQMRCGSLGWSLLSAPKTFEIYSDQNSAEVDLVEGDLRPEEDKEILPVVD